jgi:CheY-like chemotaxis protein
MSDYKRILLVDDEEQVLFVLCHSLQKLGPMYEIVTAKNGQEALDKFDEAPVDLLITDLAMPHMDGVKLTEAIRARAPDAKVVWVTAYDKWKADAERLGVFRYILKPLNLEEIRQAAREGTQASVEVPAEPPALQILVMEDTDDLRRLYCRALEKAGYKVSPAATLQEARDRLTERRFDVFFCDIHMGGDRGTDLLREQRAALDAAGTQIVMVSGDARYRDICEEMGIDFYIEKPVAIPLLITLVKRLTAHTHPPKS